MMFSLQPAPLDVLKADESLAPEAAAAAHSAMSVWTLEHCYPMLPYSSVVLESVDEYEMLPERLPPSRSLQQLNESNGSNGVGRSSAARYGSQHVNKLI